MKRQQVGFASHTGLQSQARDDEGDFRDGMSAVSDRAGERRDGAEELGVLDLHFSLADGRRAGCESEQKEDCSVEYASASLVIGYA